MYQPLSISLSIYICKNGLDPDQKERMFRQFKNVWHAIESKQSVVQKQMRTITCVFFYYISIRVYIVRSHAQIQRGDSGSEPP